MASRAVANKLPGMRGQLERPRPLREQVYDRLRAAILSGELAPGAPVIEAEIAATLGASRTPVREALRRLETEGMLEPRGARGSVVRELKRDEVECIFEIREALETLAARRASRRMNDRDLTEFERLDTRFHDRILALAEGQRLKRMLGDLRADISPWRFIALATAARRQASAEEHAAILDAFRAKDEGAIITTMAHHIVNTKRAVLAQTDGT
jgi:DNA-binding GntR family transcriptional regulator